MHRLQTTQWVIERQLGWIAAADTKVAVVIAIDTAMVAALAAAFTSAKVIVHGQQQCLSEQHFLSL